MTQQRRRVVYGGIALLVAFSLFGNQGFRRLVRHFQEKQQLDRRVRQLREDHQRLTQEVTLIQQDPAYTEYLIRKHLKYVKKGEVEYRLMKPKE